MNRIFKLQAGQKLQLDGCTVILLRETDVCIPNQKIKCTVCNLDYEDDPLLLIDYSKAICYFCLKQEVGLEDETG